MHLRSVPVIASLALGVVLALSGCGGGGDTTTVADATATATSTDGSSATPSEDASESASESPTSTPTSDPTSSASDFCTVFEQLDEAGNLENGEDVAAVFTQLAADMRATAPAEISDAVNSYADAIELIGKAASGDALSQAEIAAEQAAAVAGKAQEIATIAVWMGQNC
jgi:hypothetical protein